MQQKKHYLETYIYWSGNIGQEFVDTLSEKARQGVKIHVLLDWFGSLKMEESWIQKMRDAGIEVEKYHPLKWHNWKRLNNRTHRKILVIDGKVGFTGGVGIADEWSGHAQGPDHWRHTHYRLEGPVVAQLQSAFIDNWIEVKGDVLHGVEYFPESKEVGPHLAQVFKSSREGGANSTHLMYLLAITAAKKSIHLSIDRASFLRSDLSRANMQGANLLNANMHLANLNGADLKGAMLDAADLKNTTMVDAKLNQAHLHDARLKSADLTRADLTGAQLQGADLSGANLTSARFRDAQLQRADLSGTVMTKADFRGANMKGVKLDNATLDGADLRGAVVDEIDFYKVNTVGCLGCPVLNRPIQEVVK